MTIPNTIFNQTSIYPIKTKDPQDAMSLKNLCEGVDVIKLKGDKQALVQSLCMDSRRVMSGSLYFAVKGANSDGNMFIDQAIARGAVGIVSESPNAAVTQVPSVQVADIQLAMAQMAKRFHVCPANTMKAVGVTGTNGKSSVVVIAEFLLQKLGQRTGSIGTIEYHLGNRVLPASRTTPQALDLFSMLSEMCSVGTQIALMEVTSHGIEQRRAYGVNWDIAIFTQLGEDHIEDHGSHEDYFNCKKSFFTGALGSVPKKAILPYGDIYADKIKEDLLSESKLYTYGLSSGAQVYASEVSYSMTGTKATLHWPEGSAEFSTSLIGEHNLKNILASMTCLYALGYSLEGACCALKLFKGVPGRLEPIKLGQELSVFVDYAHTEDALRNVLGSLKPLVKGRLLVVFGCGGGRDKAKRVGMTQAVETYADIIWATADNPRNESIESIFDDMKSGSSGKLPMHFNPLRKEAIDQALSEAKEGDCVVIAGKGHEAFQEITGTMHAFDDREVVAECLSSKSAIC